MNDAGPVGPDSELLLAQEEPEAEVFSSQTLMELIPDGMFVLDDSWRFTHLNDMGERLLGRGREELLGRVLWTEFPGLLDSSFGTSCLRARAEGQALTVESLTVYQGHWYEASVLPRPQGLVVFLRDVTARHLAEMAREKSATRLSLLQEVTAKLCAVASAAEVVDVVVRGAQVALEARTLSVGLPEEEGRWLRVLTRDQSNGGPGYRLERLSRDDDAPLARVFRSGVPEWQGSFACLPMRAKGLPLAVLSLSFAPPRLIEEGDRGFLLALARQAALALERAQLFDREQAARAEAERQRARLHALVMQAPLAVSVMRGPDHVIELDNPLFQSLHGARELVGLPVHRALPGLATLGLLDVIDRVYARGEPFLEHEFPFRMDLRTEGAVEEHFQHFCYQPLRDAEGRVDGVAFFGLDVTPQVRARRALEDLAQRELLLAEAGTLLGDSLDYDLTLERLTRLVVPRLADWCSVHMLTDEGRVEPLVRLHREPKMDAAIEAVLRLQPIQLTDEQGVGRVLRTGESLLIESVSPRRVADFALTPEAARLMRSLHLTSCLCVPLVTRGRVIGALMLGLDVSERHYTRDDLRLAEELARRAAFSVDNARLYRQAQEAIRLRDEFLSIASHELRTPLTSLRLQLSFLERHLPDNARQAVGAKLDMAHRQARRLSQLITLLLDVGRVVTGRVSLERSAVDLTRMVREALERLRDLFAQHGSSVTLEAPEAVVGQWDALRLEQVIVNLLSNAAKYGQGRPVSVCVSEQGGQARLRVRDEGIGIAEEDLPRIFNRFERAVSVRHYGGLGLGLYISREIVESHGGHVTVESQPGQGSTFTVDLPQEAPAS
jgi:PAS domain S-box-containing protein